VSQVQKIIDVTPILQQAKEDVLEEIKLLVRPYQFPIVQEVSSVQQQALDKLCGGWYITACWLADPDGKSNKKLFNTPEFQDRKSWANYLSKLLKLCIGVKDCLSDFPYETAQRLSVDCLCEWKKWGVDYILNFDPGIPVYKSAKIEGLDLLYKELSKAYLCAPTSRKIAQNPFKEKDGQLHHYRLFKCAAHLAVKLPDPDRSRFCTTFWTPFLESIHAYKNTIKNNSGVKAALPGQDALRLQGVGNDRRRVCLSNPKVLTVNSDFISS
jgi:hypothetical protein